MKTSNISIVAMCFFLSGSGIATAQDDTTKQLQSTGQSLIDNPRLQSLFRSVKEDPSAAVDSLKADPDDAVREATRVFQESTKSIDLKKIDTPENRAKAKTAATGATATVSKMVPAAKEALKEVPATRPAANRAIHATPVAVPVDPSAAPAPPEASREMVVQEATVEPIATAAPTEANLPASPVLSDADVPDPEPLTPKYNSKAEPEKKKKKDTKQSMEITADESTFDQKGGDLTFKGNVYLDHPDFKMKCDTLVIEMGGGGTAMPAAGGMSNFSRAIASGGMVEMTTIKPDGTTQTAISRRADYNKVEGMVTLSGGPPFIQDGEKFVQTTAEDARIIMYMADKRYEIIGDRSRIVIPMEGKDKTEGAFPGASFDFNQ